MHREGTQYVKAPILCEKYSGFDLLESLKVRLQSRSHGQKRARTEGDLKAINRHREKQALTKALTVIR